MKQQIIGRYLQVDRKGLLRRSAVCGWKCPLRNLDALETVCASTSPLRASGPILLYKYFVAGILNINARLTILPTALTFNILTTK